MSQERCLHMHIRRGFPLIVLLGVMYGLLATPLVQAQSPCTPTPRDTPGPFYTPNAPERDHTGQGFVVSGTVRSTVACRPLGGARLEWWSANPQGEYDDAHRATQGAAADGRYRYETDIPGRYPGRPVHLHLRVTAPGHRPLITQIYPQPKQHTLSLDLVLEPE